MAIILYKPGNTSKVRGIPCEVQICNEFSYLHLLEQGWFYSPEECYAEKEQPEEPESAETEETELAEIEEIEESIPEDEIREAARKANISSWHVKSIDRLKKELEELEDGEQSEDRSY